MKKQSFINAIFVAGAILTGSMLKAQDLPPEQLLWPDGIPDNPVVYAKETKKEKPYHEGSESKMNRAFGHISIPTYTLFVPEKEKSIGVAMVICPGGGFRDVWIDREGNDFALFLKEYGITTIVLKYRTFNSDEEGFSLERSEYNPHVYADAKKAIHILRSRASELGIDKDKIGIGGYSAGGALSLFATLEVFEDQLPDYADFKGEDTRPDFACLIYPGIRDVCYDKVEALDSTAIPPMFITNGALDPVTPAWKAVKLYDALLEKGVPADLHIYAINHHGYDSGIGRGNSVSMWRSNFIAWLKDMKIME